MLNEKIAAHYSFNKGSSRQSYPSSLMGSIALLRQTYLDADWYTSANEISFQDLSLDSWKTNQELPQIFEAGDKYSILRADKVGDEFGTQYIIAGDGREYQILEDIRETDAPLIIPVNFPPAKDVSDPYNAMLIPLEDLKHWELAPLNPGLIASENITYALTSYGLKNKKDFFKNIRKAIACGLKEEDALKSLTYAPAKLLKVDEKIGQIEKGFLANFLITSGNLFEENTIIYENWILGKKYVLTDMTLPDISGKYILTAGDAGEYEIKVTGKPGKYSLEVSINDSTSIKPKLKTDGKWVSFSLDTGKLKKKTGTLRFTGWIKEKKLQGQVQFPDGTWGNWIAEYKEEF